MLVDRKTKKGKGLAYIEMESRQELEKALQLNDTQFGGRTLKVLESRPTSGRRLDAPPPPHKRQKSQGREHHGRYDLSPSLLTRSPFSRRLPLFLPYSLFVCSYHSYAPFSLSNTVPTLTHTLSLLY